MTEEQEKQFAADLLKIVHMGSADTASPAMAMAGVKAADTIIKLMSMDLKWVRTIAGIDNAQPDNSIKINADQFTKNVRAAL